MTAAHSLRAFYGESAAVQPGNLKDAMLHETAVSWVRLRDSRTQPRHLWKETVAEYGARLAKMAQYINAKHNVEGLCRELPERLRKVVESKGDRLSY